MGKRKKFMRSGERESDIANVPFAKLGEAFAALNGDISRLTTSCTPNRRDTTYTGTKRKLASYVIRPFLNLLKAEHNVYFSCL